MSPEVLAAIFKECVFDLCELEGESKQDELRCKILEEFNRECLSLSHQLNLDWDLNWRNESNCRNFF